MTLTEWMRANPGLWAAQEGEAMSEDETLKPRNVTYNINVNGHIVDDTTEWRRAELLAALQSAKSLLTRIALRVPWPLEGPRVCWYCAAAIEGACLVGHADGCEWRAANALLDVVRAVDGAPR